MPAQLEHANFTVSDPAATADWMREVFGWHLRWEGDAMAGGPLMNTSYETIGALNHIAVVVDDLDATEKAVLAQGFTTGNHADYEPGRRFYFHDADGIEYEVVQYD